MVLISLHKSCLGSKFRQRERNARKSRTMKSPAPHRQDERLDATGSVVKPKCNLTDRPDAEKVGQTTVDRHRAWVKGSVQPMAETGRGMGAVHACRSKVQRGNNSASMLRVSHSSGTPKVRGDLLVLLHAFGEQPGCH